MKHSEFKLKFTKFTLFDFEMIANESCFFLKYTSLCVSTQKNLIIKKE